MTQAMTPEERAKAVIEQAFDGRRQSGQLLDFIAAAIRDAENAAMERAALHAEDQSIHPLAEVIGKAIRSLKHPETA
jgi:KaiC/GvpD/RAD55 family RecA-like ATPase